VTDRQTDKLPGATLNGAIGEGQIITITSGFEIGIFTYKKLLDILLNQR